MFRQRVWVASLAIWIILTIQDPKVAAGIPGTEKNPTTIISPKALAVGSEIEGKNAVTLTDGDSPKISRNRLKLGLSHVPGAANTLGTKFYLGSGESRIEKNPKNDEFYNLNGLHSTGLNSDNGKLRRDKNGESELLRTKNYAEYKRQVTEMGSALDQEKSLRRDTANLDIEQLNLERPQPPRFKDDPKFNKYEKSAAIPEVARALASTESRKSNLSRRSVESDNGRTYFAVGRGNGKLEDKSNRVTNSRMVKDDDESHILGVSEEKMQLYERSAGREISPEIKVDREIGAKESLEFLTPSTAASTKVRIVTGDQPTAKSFNESNIEASLTKNVKSGSYSVSGNQRGVESDIPSRPNPMNYNYFILHKLRNGNSDDGSGRPSRDDDKLESDSRRAINCIGKTKSNKKLPIGLSVVSYAAYNLGVGRSTSDIERSPIPKFEIEESYRRTDVVRDMRHEGDPAATVANELAYSDVGFHAAKVPGNIVEEIGVTDEDGIGLVPAVISKFNKGGESISHAPLSRVIPLGSHEIRDISKSPLIKDELFKTSRDEIHPRGEITDLLRKRNNLLGRDKTLPEMGGKISEENLSNNKNKNNAEKNRRLRVLKEQSTDSTEVIGGYDHVPRESPRKIAAVRSSRKENDHLGIIETLNGGYLRSGEKKTSGNVRSVDTDGRTTRLNIRTTGTVANSLRDNRERLEQLGDIQPRESSVEVGSSELFDGRDILNRKASRDGLLRKRISNSETNQQNAHLQITGPVERKFSKTEFRRNSNETDEIEILVENSRPMQGSEIGRNGDVRKTTVDVRGKLSGNLLPEIQRDEEVIRNSKSMLQNSEKLEEDEANGNKATLLGMKKIERNIVFYDTKENLMARETGMNLRRESPLFESNADDNMARDAGIDINTTMDRTAMIEASPQNGLRVNLLAGQKNDEELRSDDTVDGDGVSRTMGKKETNLPDKLWGGKTGVVNLSAFDISGYGFPTERYLEMDPKNNKRGKSSVEIVSLVGNETFSKLKQTRKFPLENSNGPEIKSKKFLLARMRDKYSNSKTKRAMKSSGMKIIPEATEDTDERKTAVHPPPPNYEDKVSGARNSSREKTSIAINNSGTSSVADSSPKSSKNNTRLFSRSFADRSEVKTTGKSSNQSAQSYPANMDLGQSVSGSENSYGFENSSGINVSSENKGSLFDVENTTTENPAVSQLSHVIPSDSNQTYPNDDIENVTSWKILEALRPLNSDLVVQDILKFLPKNSALTEIPLETTLEIIEAVTQSSNIPFSLNQTDSDNTSRAATAPNQWPVKHSAVVEGDLVLGGLMMVHEREDSVTCGPVMPQGGVQALEAMLYTLDRLNEDDIIPGVKIGAHILDDCDKDTYGLEMAVDFIKGSISNIDGAEYHCNKTAVRKVISGVVGAASSVTSIQVANLLRLFRIPQVSFFSTSPELSNKQRFEYFTRTIPSDHYQVKAMVDIVRQMNWSYVSIIYEESNYGIKAFEELEDLLAKYDICIAIKEKLVKDSGVAEETAYDNIVQKLLTKPRARGCIIFGSDQEVAGVMRAVRRCNATGAFSWIGSDGWSARGLVSDGNEAEVEGTLSVQPQANPVKGFEEYFLNLTVENNRRNPWFVEFWEDHFQCRYPNASRTPYNQKYTKPCTTRERLSKQNTAFEDQLQFVSDAVTAFAYAFQGMHKDLCNEKRGLCDAMKPTKGTELLKYLRKVDFHGLSGDKFKFDKNGDGPARYNIIHFKQVSPGKYKWIRVGEYMEGELRLNMSEIQFRLRHPLPPESVCSLPCEVGQAKKYVEGESCCWHCFNCTQYQVRHPLDETQCVPCPQGRVPDETHSNCRDIPEEFLRPESGWAIGAMSFSATGILVTLFVGGVFLRHNDTPVVRASGRELSYVLLTGILLCYLVTFALVLRPNNIVCGIQRFGAGFCFTVVYAALLTKTNRIARIFNAGKQSAKRPSFISPRSQLIICSGLMGIQILINVVWMIIDPAKAMHHYPTREDNLLVCSSYIDASYMIAFSYPIILIVVCTVYAVLTRKIPEAFNESKHIGFTMYTTCVIWLAFVPLYFGTGNHVALRITSMSVTISLSASVTIACLFSPKLYIILIRPERNVRQSMMPVRYSTTKSSAVTGTNASSMMAAVTLTAATCDQNKAVKRHVTTTIDCSTQSEYYEMEVKEDHINGKTPLNLISRSTQTQIADSETNSTYGSVINVTDTAIIPNKEIIKDSTTTQKPAGKEINNVRIGNGPVSHKDGAF